MAELTSIPWADATINPIDGCSKISPGCNHCYAEARATRFRLTPYLWTPDHAHDNISVHLERLTKLQRWSPRTIFVCSLSDPFNHAVSVDTQEAIYHAIRANPQHAYIILTKRPERLRSFIDRMQIENPSWFNSNGTLAIGEIWHGISAENQATLDQRWQILAQTPVQNRILSLEPLLGYINITPTIHPLTPLPRPNWIIIGGESGRWARPMVEWWAKSIADYAEAYDIPIMVKQLGGHPDPRSGHKAVLYGKLYDNIPDPLRNWKNTHERNQNNAASS